jgi:hypothetical protein
METRTGDSEALLLTADRRLKALLYFQNLFHKGIKAETVVPVLTALLGSTPQATALNLTLTSKPHMCNRPR